MKHTLRHRDNDTSIAPRFYIVTEYTLTDAPVLITIWTRAVRSEGPIHSVNLPADASPTRSGGYQVKSSTGLGSAWVYCNDLEPEEERTETPIPPPKTKLATRWHNGAWQKQSKRGVWS